MPGSAVPEAGRRAIGWGLAAAVALLLLFAAPVPYVLYEPGVVVPVGELVAVDKTDRPDRDASPHNSGLEDESATSHPTGQPDGGASPDRPGDPGGWLLTTVALRERATLWTVIASAWRPDREAHAKRSVFQGSGKEEFRLRMGVRMAESQAKATEAAFRAAGVAYAAAPGGVVVVRGAGPFMTGDRITAVNGAEVAGLAELYGALSARAGRESVLTVLRGGVEIDVRPDDAGADLNAREGAPGGAELIEIPDIRPDDPAIRVTIDAGSLAGPSAGLPLALHLYEELTGESLTGARRIAATGTIEPTGEVGAVGGVALKAIAASRAGAELFLVPEANLAEAAEAAEAGGGGMAVAGVGTLEEAISLLRAGPDQAR